MNSLENITWHLLEQRNHVTNECIDDGSCILDKGCGYDGNRYEYQRILGHGLTARSCSWSVNSLPAAHRLTPPKVVALSGLNSRRGLGHQTLPGDPS